MPPFKDVMTMVCIAHTTVYLMRMAVKRLRRLYTVKAPQIQDATSAGDDGEMFEMIFSSDTAGCCLYQVNPDCRSIYCKVRNERRLVELLNSAQRNISVSMYMFTNKALYRSIVAAFARGVRVRIICCNSMMENSATITFDLLNNNIPLRFPSNTAVLMHHKFCLIDTDSVQEYERYIARQPLSQSQDLSRSYTPPVKLPPGGILLTGSMNWTHQAMCGNWDNIMITSQPQCIREFAKEFEVCWFKFKPRLL